MLQELFRKCTSQELRWIFHVVLSDVEMEVGIPHPTTILGWFHNRAYELLNAGNLLKEICEDLMEGEQAGGLAGLHNLLFKPLRPMLLKRLSYNKNALPKVSPYRFSTRLEDCLLIIDFRSSNRVDGPSTPRRNTTVSTSYCTSRATRTSTTRGTETTILAPWGRTARPASRDSSTPTYRSR